jgi:hypothetical protein
VLTGATIVEEEYLDSNNNSYPPIFLLSSPFGFSITTIVLEIRQYTSVAWTAFIYLLLPHFVCAKVLFTLLWLVAGIADA